MGFVRSSVRFCLLLPVLIVYGTTLWALYVVDWTVGMMLVRTGSILGGSVLSGSALMLYLLTLWSYSKAVFRSPGTTKRMATESGGYIYLSPAVASLTASITVKWDGRLRYCKKCLLPKPDRTHHCSICKQCILKMDHHCPWLATCVGFRNQKPFIQFLVYLFLFSVLCSAASALSFYHYVMVNQQISSYVPVQWLLLAIIAGVVALAEGGFTGWHISLILRNITTIEALEGNRYKGADLSNRQCDNPASLENPYNLGYRRNWRQVMGNSLIEWLLPIDNAIVGSGILFEINGEAARALSESSENGANSVHDQEYRTTMV